MKHVNFNSIKLKNFLSVGNDLVEVNFKTGISVITGTNKDKLDRRNGVGKSTIADSIHFAIFGETIREIPKGNIINNITQKGTYVELSFSITEGQDVNHYKIIRTLKPTKCFLYINDEDKTESTIINTTNRIKELLSASAELFQNCVIMSLNTTLPFMAQKKVEKRKFIEGILKLEVFSQMLQVARTEHNDILRDYESVNKELVHQNNYKDITIKQLEDKKEENNNKIDRCNLDIDRKNKKIVTLQEQITEPNLKLVESIREKKIDFDVKIAEIQKTIENFLLKRIGYEAEITMYNKTYRSIGTDLSKCPVCLHEISSDDRTHIEEEKNKITNDIKAREEDIKDIYVQIDNLKVRKSTYISESDKCKSFLKECLAAVESNKRVKSSIDDLKEEIAEINKEIASINGTSDNYSDLNDQLEKYSKEVSILGEQVETLSKNNKILEFVKFILSEEGVKSYIVKKILNILNNRLLYYLDKMDANCVCKFNEFFEEEIKNDKGQECSYFNFSGAERKNIDLACLFTFMDIRRMQGDVSYNLVVFDELLDSSLDEKGVELVIKILKERVDQYKEGIYIISHRKESTKESSGEVIYLEKSNGITRRVEYNN
jgi:DNA repair exonuclease SbcCD ATPase subunit